MSCERTHQRVADGGVIGLTRRHNVEHILRLVNHDFLGPDNETTQQSNILKTLFLDFTAQGLQTN